MFSGLISFFGGAAFRWVLGEVLGFLKAKQEHAQELAMLKLQQDIEREKHQWQQDAIKAQADAGVKVIEAQSDATARGAADQMMLTAIEQIGRPTGVAWVDGWNGAIRPALATVAIMLIVGNAVAPTHVALSGVVLEVVAGVLGLFIGGRITTTGR